MVEKIIHLSKLRAEETELEKKLSQVRKSIEEKKRNCLHIAVNLGYSCSSSNPGDKYRCLICQKGKDDSFCGPAYIVHAEDYLKKFHISDDKQCDEKFETIQILALGILKENPDFSRAELTDALNNMIQQSISLKNQMSKSKVSLEISEDSIEYLNDESSKVLIKK